jgi:putative heme-binding domain-containing protein
MKLRKDRFALFWTLGAALPLALSAQTPDRNDPAAELTSFKVASGFEVTLFASEQDGIIKPIAHRFDRLGRLWVIGSITYPQIQPGEAPNDYVKILEDTNGDGKADKVTTFADGLMIPTGIEIDPDARGCWVSEGTKLWHMRDEDGDGRADKKEAVLRGFGTGDNHQNINSFRWSPGGELFMSQGLHAFSRVETPHGITKLDEAGYFRFRPRRQQLDAFWGGPAEPQNPWGFVWDDWGALFIQAGNNGGLFDALPSAFAGGVSKRPPSIWENARGRKCSNPDIVGTAHFPREWQDAVIAPGYINNAVWTLRLSPDGSGWVARDSEPLITSSHGSFRPMDAKFAPDGSLYIADWYNPIIGHYQASFRHPDRDKQHGRIWRVTAKGRSLVKPPEFLKRGLEAPVADLLTGLESDERFVREHARRLLGSMPANKVLKPVIEWAKARGNDRALFDALCIHEWHETPEWDLLSSAFKAREPRLRAYAAGTFVRWSDGQSTGPAKTAGQTLAAWATLSRDEDARVRLAAVVAAGNRRSDPVDVEVVLRAGEEPTDARLDYARQQSVLRLRAALPQAVEKFAAEKAEWRAFLENPAKPIASAPAPKADPKLAAMVGDALRQPANAGRLAPEAVAALAAEVRERGDAKRGRDIYRRADLACTACHRVGDEGGQLGPDLTNLGSAQPLDFIIGAVVEPQREIKEGFETREVRTTDGRVLVGFRRAAEAGEVALLDASTQRETRVKKAEVAGEKTLGSLMPAGLIDKLSKDEQRDLFRYLSELGKQR